MKRFTEHINNIIANKNTQVEQPLTNGQPGNSLDRKVGTGITNMYAPPQNVIVYLNNTICTAAGIVCDLASDNTTIKLTSSRFSNQEMTRSMIYDLLDFGGKRLSIYQILYDNGYNNIKILDYGNGNIAVFAAPVNVATADPCVGDKCCDCDCECGCDCSCCKDDKDKDKDKKSSKAKSSKGAKKQANEAEVYYLDDNMITESEDEEVSESDIPKLIDILKKKDKVKAAKEFAQGLAKYFYLPKEFYFACVHPSYEIDNVALRWKYKKRVPDVKGTAKEKKAVEERTQTEITHTLINFIFDDNNEFIWVPDYDKDGYFQLPDEAKKLIENILDLLDVEKGQDPCVFTLKKEEDKSKDADKTDADETDDYEEDTDEADN